MEVLIRPPCITLYQVQRQQPCIFCHTTKPTLFLLPTNQSRTLPPSSPSPPFPLSHPLHHPTSTSPPQRNRNKNMKNKTKNKPSNHTPPTNPSSSPPTSLTTPTSTSTSTPTLTLLSPIPSKHLPTLSPLLTSLERKIFPSSSSSTSFNYPLELKKPTIGVILAYPTSSTTITPSTTFSITSPSSSTLPPPQLPIGYLVFQRLKGTTWLHKLGVVEGERRKGVARGMIGVMKERVRVGGGRKVVLWVEEGNAARRLYEEEGWEVRERMEGYYGEGRAGVRMEMDI